MALTPGVIDTINGWTGVDQKKANLAQTQANTQDKIMQNIQAQQKADIDKRMAELLQGAALAPPAKDDKPDLETQSDGSMVPVNSANPYAQAVKGAGQQVQQLTQLAELARQAGNVPGFDKANEDLTKARQELRQNQKDMVEYQTTQAKLGAQTFGGVQNMDDVKAALEWTKQTQGPEVANKIAKQIATTIPDLEKATPNQIRAAVAPIANQFATMGEQFRMKEAQQASADRAATLAETQARDRQTKIDQDRRAALNQRKLSDSETKEAHLQEQRVNREDRLKSVAAKPSTKLMRDSAKDTIKADPDFQKAKFDSSIDALAGDVADRANKIRADAFRGGEDMSLDDARQQALDELRPFVKNELVGEHQIGSYKWGGEPRSTYRRPGGASSEAPAADKAPNGGDADVAKAVQAAGGTYEPDKYEYRVVDGKVQRRAK